MKPGEQLYLGDGLYAKCDRWGRIILSAPRDGTEHYVVMDREVLSNFLLFVAEMKQQEARP